MTGTAFDAIVLAGGRGSRLGQDKAAVRIADERLVDRVIRATRVAGAARVIVVGPEEVGRLADACVREEPPFAGPLAAVAAALPELRSAEVLLLACDLESPKAVVAALTREALDARIKSAPEQPQRDGLVLVDARGREQWLAARYRSTALRQAILPLERTENLSLRHALGALVLTRLPAADTILQDIDTPADLRAARQRSEAAQHQKESP